MNARVFAITAFALTTHDLDRLAWFYAGLGFTAEPPEPIPEADMMLLGLRGGGTRRRFQFGPSCVMLECFDQQGQQYPESATAADLCLQHFALVTTDAAAAWTRAVRLGATAISPNGPVTLPASSGGVTACKFRDPDGHPLEFLQFPSRPGQHTDRSSRVDHSAISVSDAERSERFYETLGLAVTNRTLNQGAAQEALDGLEGAVVDVVAMMPPSRKPHLELLGYRSPVGRPAALTAANDVAATRTVWAASCDALLRDPDGHLHVLKLDSVPTGLAAGG